jgi:hypothetical protein
MQQKSICIHCEATELLEGLFGQVLLYVFELLPYLHARSIFPAWEIRSTLYGAPPDYMTLPGVLDLAYDPPPSPYRLRVPLSRFREKHCEALGNDWAKLSRIWHAYFKVPDRIVKQADSFSLNNTLGVHYRGTDKQTETFDSNPITQDQYLALVIEFLANRPDIEQVFAATDEFTFVDKLRSAISLPIINLGEVGFHKETSANPMEKADRALLDCVLLSRCATALQTSSALPSFAKIFNPDLEMYRCAASKLFKDIPYFPVAYVPKIALDNPETQSILNATMNEDWTMNPKTQRRFKKTFAHVTREPLKSGLWDIAEKLAGK